MDKLIPILLGLGMMLPMVIVLVTKDEEVIAKVCGMLCASYFVIGLILFIMGVTT